MHEAAERLTERCRELAGDSLRAVVLYSETGDDVVYLREDLEATYEAGEMDAIAVTAYELHDDLRTFGSDSLDMTGYWGTVHVFDDVVAMQFVYDASHGVLVSFDPDVGQNLHEFVRDCQGILHG